MVWFESRSICRQEEFVRDLGQCQANGISQGTRRAEKKSPLHSSFSSHLPVCTFVLPMKSAQKALNMRYMLSSGPLMMEFDRPPANTMGSLLTHQFLSSPCLGVSFLFANVSHVGVLGRCTELGGTWGYGGSTKMAVLVTIIFVYVLHCPCILQIHRKIGFPYRTI